MGSFIELAAADGSVFPAYQATPKGTPKAAIVVLQEIFGVNAHIRAVADRFAAQGYLAVAPATFHRVKAGVELGYTGEDVTAGVALKAAVEALPVPGVLQDVQAAVDFAAAAVAGKGVPGPVGLVGYCWGGLLTWRAASLLQGVTAAVPYYGGGMTQPAELARVPKCPVLVHLGEKDQSIPDATVEPFRRAHPEVDVRVYKASHGFNCDHRSAYDGPAATAALESTLAFFAKHLG